MTKPFYHVMFDNNRGLCMKLTLIYLCILHFVISQAWLCKLFLHTECLNIDCQHQSLWWGQKSANHPTLSSSSVVSSPDQQLATENLSFRSAEAQLTCKTYKLQRKFETVHFCVDMDVFFHWCKWIFMEKNFKNHLIILFVKNPHYNTEIK